MYGYPREVFTVDGTDAVAFSWTRCDGRDDPEHVHSIGCLWVWHDCTKVMPDEPNVVESVRGKPLGWQPTGVGAHTLHAVEPLHLEASLYWPECCGLHGFIREGRWIPA
jgi:hypothetical protein